MHDQPEPTPEEQEQVPERQPEEEAMRGPGHDDPERATEPQDDAEIHDA
ncbi:MAG TPA: hypothetical protein VE753_01740 [Gaiellaceae bacterium]|jgi:hypothetical protein|nr:hypothetical protein [Gaiellaceae bacterium]